MEFRVGKTKYPAVIITERPSLESIEALTDLQNLVIEWSANESLAGCSLAVWNTADLFTPPQLIPLTQDQVKESVADLALETLPPGEVLGISIAREVRGFVKSFSIASLSTNPKQAAAVCLHRSTGEVYTAGDEPQFWPHLFFEMRVSSLFGRLLPKFWFMKRLRTLNGMGQSFPFQILEYMNSDTEFHRLGKFSKTWIPIVKNLFALIAKDSTSYERTCPMDDAHYKNFIELLERLGVARHSQHSSTIAPTDSQFPDGLRLEHQTGCVVSSKQDKYLLVFPKQGFDLQTAKEHYFSRDPNAGQLTFETAEFRFTDLTLVDQNLVQSAYKASQNKSSLTSLADMLIGCRFDFSAEFKNGWRACNLILRSGLPDAGNQRRKQPRRR